MTQVREKNSDIEVLRGFAITMVLISHLVILSPVPLPGLDWVQQYFGFWTGVDLFFAISGFVISRSILRTVQGHSSKSDMRAVLKAFWIKRVFRLFPSAWLWILIPVIIAALMPVEAGFVRLHDLAGYVSVAFLNVANIFSAIFIAESGARYLIENPLAHYWSLSMEEQFYVVLPLVMLLVPRRLLLIALLMGIALQFNFDRLMFSLGWYARTDALMWGVLLGLLYDSNAYQRLSPVFLRGHITGPALFTVLLALLAWVTFELGSLDFAAGRRPATCAIGVISAICAAMVFIASFDCNYLMHPGPFKRLMVWLGERSYSLYLIHHTMFMVVAALYKMLVLRGASDQAGPMIVPVVIGLGVSLLLAEINYRFIEVPARDHGRRLAH